MDHSPPSVKEHQRLKGARRPDARSRVNAKSLRSLKILGLRWFEVLQGMKQIIIPGVTRRVVSSPIQ